MQTNVLVISSIYGADVVRSAADLSKVWPVHPEDMSQWNVVRVPSLGAPEFKDKPFPQAESGDRVFVVLDGVDAHNGIVTDSELCDDLYKFMLDVALGDPVLDAPDHEHFDLPSTSVWVRGPRDVTFTPFRIESNPVKEGRVRVATVIVSEDASIGGEVSANCGALTIHVHPLSKGHKVRGHSVSAVIVNTDCRLHPQLLATLNASLKSTGGPLIHVTR